MIKSSVLGYPRIGANREWKKTLEAYWAGQIGETEFESDMRNIRLNRLRTMRDKGIELVPVGDFSYYDGMLDTAAMFGLVPKRFRYDGGPVPLSVYFGIARGTSGAAASEMTKWFNTNYHYIVPELEDDSAEEARKPQLTENKPLLAYREAKRELGIEGKPVIVGPLTFVKLSKGYRSETELDQWLDKFVPLYVQVLRELADEGAQWAQLDEPIAATELSDRDVERLQKAYRTFAEKVPELSLILQTYFESVDRYRDIVRLPVRAIGLDFVHGAQGNLEAIRKHGFPRDKTLAAGVIDGRGVWRANLRERLELLNELAAAVSPDRLVVQSSCSLLHVPVTVAAESRLEAELKDALAFADEKLEEIAWLAATAVSTEAYDVGASPDNDRTAESVAVDNVRAENGLAAVSGECGIAAAFSRNERLLAALQTSASRNRADVRQAVAELARQEPQRQSPFAERRVIQQSKWNLPIFPTTTIGSFPQTAEVRKARQLWRKGEWDDAVYTAFIRGQIDTWMELQQQLGLDVLVHGEFERTDMVEFFGEKLAGFAFTQNGWVQSYGSRCVKPPIIYGDVAFEGAMTVEETAYAQSRTAKPVKGMLTGPITIMNWSFVRDDISREQIAYQLAYALRQEVEALERAGIGMIQVDEPAVREGLPLKRADQSAYLEWAVRAFRMTTCTVQDTTQIHTHMCYCEFHDMIRSIEDLDADVISIETSRSHGELIHHFETNAYSHGIGLGVYDIHSPRVPDVAEMTGMIDRALQVLAPALFWINPDCGLKTRGFKETVESLANMVEAARISREKYHVYIERN